MLSLRARLRTSTALSHALIPGKPYLGWYGAMEKGWDFEMVVG